MYLSKTHSSCKPMQNVRVLMLSYPNPQGETYSGWRLTSNDEG